MLSFITAEQEGLAGAGWDPQVRRQSESRRGTVVALIAVRRYSQLTLDAGIGHGLVLADGM